MNGKCHTIYVVFVFFNIYIRNEEKERCGLLHDYKKKKKTLFKIKKQQTNKTEKTKKQVEH